MNYIIYDLAGTAKMKVLQPLSQNPGKSFFEKEIAEKAKVSRGAAHDSLKDLAKKGLVVKEKKGRMNFYRANTANPLVRALKNTINIANLLPLVKKLQGISLQIILFGSFARGENYPDSDIDLLILTQEKEKVEKIIKQSKTSLLRPIIKTPAEFAVLEDKKPTFYQEIMRGVVLWEKNT